MGIKVAQVGPGLENAQAAVILVHGRGAPAETMLALAKEIHRGQAGGVAFLAPQAPGFTWYPYSFLAPFEQNEPDLSNSLANIAELLAQVETAGIPPERTALVGFSQGACLALEFTARNARRYGGVAGLSGGLMGPPGTRRDYPGSLDGTPVFLGCSKDDPHIPVERVQETAHVLEEMGAQVTSRIYSQLGHTITDDEISMVRQMITGLLSNGREEEC